MALDLLVWSVVYGRTKPDQVLASLEQSKLVEAGRIEEVARDVLIDASLKVGDHVEDLRQRRIPNLIVAMLIAAAVTALAWLRDGETRRIVVFLTASFLAFCIQGLAALLVNLARYRRRLIQILDFLDQPPGSLPFRF